MTDQFSRTRLLFGEEAMEKFAAARVAVFGVGGVGGHCIEALARSGIVTLDIIDNDVVSITNINRQAVAFHSTIGKSKTEIMRERILDISPAARVNVYNTFYLPETAHLFDFMQYDYIVDAIDTVTGKIMLIEQAKAAQTPIISCMGTGNKLDPTRLTVADISKTSVCPLAKVMRRELKKRGIENVKVVYSTEEPIKPVGGEETKGAQNRPAPASCAFVPSVAGLIMAGEVLKDIAKIAKI